MLLMRRVIGAVLGTGIDTQVASDEDA